MDANTPAREIRETDRAKNTAAFSDCLRELLLRTQPRRVLDVRYGLGGWAVALHDLFKPDVYVGFEADKKTWDAAAKPSGVICYQERFNPLNATSEAPYDLVLADFNNLTMLKSKPLTSILEDVSPESVIFTDVAVCKLHLNFNSYGLKFPSPSQYFKKFNRSVLPDWELVHLARHHHAAATAAFTLRRDR